VKTHWRLLFSQGGVRCCLLGPFVCCWNAVAISADPANEGILDFDVIHLAPQQVVCVQIVPNGTFQVPEVGPVFTPTLTWGSGPLRRAVCTPPAFPQRVFFFPAQFPSSKRRIHRRGPPYSSAVSVQFFLLSPISPPQLSLSRRYDPHPLSLCFSWLTPKHPRTFWVFFFSQL